MLSISLSLSLSEREREILLHRLSYEVYLNNNINIHETNFVSFESYIAVLQNLHKVHINLCVLLF